MTGEAKEADAHRRVDLRPAASSSHADPSRVVTVCDTELAERISVGLSDLGLDTAPARARAYRHPVAMLELAIDAMDIPAIRTFWQAALAYVDDPADSGPTGALVDPVGQ